MTAVTVIVAVAIWSVGVAEGSTVGVTVAVSTGIRTRHSRRSRVADGW